MGPKRAVPGSVDCLIASIRLGARWISSIATRSMSRIRPPGSPGLKRTPSDRRASDSGGPARSPSSPASSSLIGDGPIKPSTGEAIRILRTHGSRNRGNMCGASVTAGVPRGVYCGPKRRQAVSKRECKSVQTGVDRSVVALPVSRIGSSGRYAVRAQPITGGPRPSARVVHGTPCSLCAPHSLASPLLHRARRLPASKHT